MQVKVTPNYASSGPDHHIENGYMVLNDVFQKVYLDGEKIEPDTERFYRVQKVEAESANNVVHLSS